MDNYNKCNGGRLTIFQKYFTNIIVSRVTLIVTRNAGVLDNI